jgi:hypothetical protein
VALDGDTLAVSAPNEDSKASGVGGDQSNNDLISSGAVYVFTRDGSGAWSQQAYLKASSPDANDRFGGALALSGDVLAVGAEGEDGSDSGNDTGLGGSPSDNGRSSSGAVYLFRRDDAGQWSGPVYIKKSTPPGATFGSDSFGQSVALDAGLLAVGADSENSDATGVDNVPNSYYGASGSGAVFVRRILP